MALQQPGAQLVQRRIGPRRDLRADHLAVWFQRPPELATPGPRRSLPRPLPPKPCLVNVRNAHLEQRRCLIHRRPAIHSRENPIAQILRMAFP